ncbi:MAG: hypothetical protein KJP26_02275 [Maribacter sp.]|nr:hypothetical protein [Maribacter sp.]
MTTGNKTYGFQVKLILILISLILTPLLETYANYEVVPDNPASLNSLPEPSLEEKELLQMFDAFDALYSKRQNGQVSGKQWEALGYEFTTKLGSIGQKLTKNWDLLDKEIYPGWSTYSTNKNVGINYLFRASLIMGECFLFASQQYFEEEEDTRFRLNYEKGISVLDQIIIAAEIFTQKSPNSMQKLEILPDFLNDYEVIENQIEGNLISTIKMNPYAGMESIGTGLKQKGVAGIGTLEARKITYSPKPYISTADLVQIIKNDLNQLLHLGQLSTIDTARSLLAEFCPWGVDLYFLLKNAGLTKDLNFKILKPFSGYETSLLQKVIKGFKEFPDAIMGWPIESQDEIPPLISEQVLKNHQVPQHIFDEMKQIIGGEDKKGFLDLDKKRPIEWEWVEKEPTCTIWYTSPTVFDWDSNDYLKVLFTTIKLFKDPVGFAFDEVYTGLVNSVQEISGDQSDLHITAKVAVELNDKGFLTTDFIKKGEWLSQASALRKVASYTFDAVDEQMLQDRTEGIDPANYSMGLSYNGSSIPPIILRAEMLGFEKVADDEYPRTIKAVRFYLFYPENIANKGPFQGYDLSNNYGNKPVKSGLFRGGEYLAEQKSFQNNSNASESVRKISWNKLPKKANVTERIFSSLDGSTRPGALLGPVDELAAFEILTDFTPKKHKISFSLSEETQQMIANNRNLIEVELWAMDGTKYVISKLPMLLQIEHIDMTLIHGEGKEAPISNEEWGGNYFPYERLLNIPLQIVPLKTQYYLRFKVNGQYTSKTYTVNIDKGRKAQREITGKLTSPESGEIRLDFEPEIEIPFGEVTKGKVQSGKAKAIQMLD